MSAEALWSSFESKSPFCGVILSTSRVHREFIPCSDIADAVATFPKRYQNILSYFSPFLWRQDLTRVHAPIFAVSIPLRQDADESTILEKMATMTPAPTFYCYARERAVAPIWVLEQPVPMRGEDDHRDRYIDLANAVLRYLQAATPAVSSLEELDYLPLPGSVIVVSASQVLVRDGIAMRLPTNMVVPVTLETLSDGPVSWKALEDALQPMHVPSLAETMVASVRAGNLDPRYGR